MSSSPETNSTSHIVPDAPLHPTSPGGNGHRPQVHAHPFNVPHSPLHNPHRRGFIGSPKATLGKAPVGYFPQTSPYTSRSVPGSPLLHHYHHTPPVPLTLLPRMPFLTPDHAEQRKAMETAAAAERQRSKDLEIKEAGLAVAELHGVLKRERQRMARIAGELAAMRTVAGHSQLEAEVMEEGRINSLMRKMDKIQEDKGRVILELEREEEMVRLMYFLCCRCIILFGVSDSCVRLAIPYAVDQHIAKEARCSPFRETGARASN